ncbi:MAG: aminotransferase class I/II-fold pyridoxal phosphate-dependent enzyme [Clostridiaceae bacterium]|nr:aminotransferase class I/II-fold pyridoxal phosphate-dependent enzyme [Clostridiaceae bacterium]
MKDFNSLSIDQLEELKYKLQEEYDKFKNQNMKLDMSRGKPGADQLELSMGLFDSEIVQIYKASDGTDCRNYGGLEGIPEMRKLFADMFEISPAEIIVGGNASLNLMFDMISQAMSHGVAGSDVPWGKLPSVKFLCPSPGYDRHFAICEYFNIEMITIPMKGDGPDMDLVEELVADDEYIKGMWCVPKYSNPDGITYSDEVVKRLANMKTKSKDFRIFWDNAYAVHHLYDDEEKQDKLMNILKACKEAGNPGRVFMFTSTSKITFPGSGVSAIGASENNISEIIKRLKKQTISYDKLNQLRHVKFLKNVEGIREHMKKHAAILRPKFELVLNYFEKDLGDKNIAKWTKPNGGYFISLYTLKGCAKKVVSKAKEAGVTLTPAGASYPYGNDPDDSNIRIAPSYPPLGELEKAVELLCICVQLVSVEKILEAKK